MVVERLFNKVKPIWDSYLEHNFIKELENGSLDKEKFKFYLIQDYLYLMDYSKVFAYAIIKSKDENHMRFNANQIISIIGKEADTHRGYFTDFGINNANDYEASITTESYTKYMLAVAATENLAEIMVTVLACYWSYKYIADNLNKEMDSGIYKNWILMYSSKEYAKGNDELIKLINYLTKDYTEEEILNLEKIIVNCSKYEYMFWDMAYNKEM